MAKRDLLTEFKTYYDSKSPDAQELIRRFILTEAASPKSQPVQSKSKLVKCTTCGKPWSDAAHNGNQEDLSNYHPFSAPAPAPRAVRSSQSKKRAGLPTAASSVVEEEKESAVIAASGGAD